MRLSLRAWVSSGLTTYFFLVVGLEARRESDMGAPRDRRGTALPLAAAMGGTLASVAVCLALDAGIDCLSRAVRVARARAAPLR